MKTIKKSGIVIWIAVIVSISFFSGTGILVNAADSSSDVTAEIADMITKLDSVTMENSDISGFTSDIPDADSDSSIDSSTDRSAGDSADNSAELFPADSDYAESYSGNSGSSSSEKIFHKPQLLLEESNLSGQSLNAGTTFEMSVTFHNKSRSQNIFGLKISPSTETTGIEFVKNSFYVQRLTPGESVTINPLMTIAKDAQPVEPVALESSYCPARPCRIGDFRYSICSLYNGYHRNSCKSFKSWERQDLQCNGKTGGTGFSSKRNGFSWKYRSRNSLRWQHESICEGAYRFLG